MNTSLDTPPVRRYFEVMATSIIFSSTTDAALREQGVTAESWRDHGIFQIKEDFPSLHGAHTSMPRSGYFVGGYLVDPTDVIPYDTARFWSHP